MDHDTLIAHIQGRTGLPTAEEAAASAEAVLEGIGERTALVDARAAARELGDLLGGALLRGAEREGELSVDGLFRRVASARRVPLSEAVEEVVSVAQVLSGALSEEARAHLTVNQPSSWRALFDVVEEAQTPSGLAHDVLAQSGSVAGSHNPHATDKLSSAHPAPVGKPMSVGRPGSERPLSEGGGEPPRR